MLIEFLIKQLAPKIEEMKAKDVILCMDKGLAFKKEEAKAALELGGTRKVKEVWILPTIVVPSMLVHLIITYGTH